MQKPEAFILKLLGTKFEIVPYFTRGPDVQLLYRIVCRHFAPPSGTDFIATPQDMRALLAWLEYALAVDLLDKESTDHE